MIIEIIVAMLLGIACGTFTGLLPGIHINLIASILLANILFFEKFHLALTIFITAMSTTHVFLEFIPSIFLGAPDEDSFLSILPGHEMLKEGKGYEACILALYGCLFSLILIAILFPVYI